VFGNGGFKKPSPQLADARLGRIKGVKGPFNSARGGIVPATSSTITLSLPHFHISPLPFSYF